MNPLDSLLYSAWHRVAAALRDDPDEAARRFARTRNRTYRKPLRDCCLVIRASDTRLNDHTAAIDPPGACARREPHDVHLDADILRQLTKPVMIPWPGLPLQRAAAQLGVTPQILRGWTTRDPDRFVISRRDNAMSHGCRGQPIPIVYTPSPINPGNLLGRAPNPVWGTLWQWMWELIPDDFHQVIRRVPYTRPMRGRRVHAGWRWHCPGLLHPSPPGRGAGGEGPSSFPLPPREGARGWVEPPTDNSVPDPPDPHPAPRTPHPTSPCSHLCRYLYLPVPIWTIPRAIDSDLELTFPPARGLAGTWSPGREGSLVPTGHFACKRCRGVRELELTSYAGWNDYITLITGGLLYGHEVPRPLDLVPATRRRRPFRQVNRRPAPRREQIKSLLIDGLTYKQIAARLGITRSTVNKTATQIYKLHNARGRADLIKKCRGEVAGRVAV